MYWGTTPTSAFVNRYKPATVGKMVLGAKELLSEEYELMEVDPSKYEADAEVRRRSHTSTKYWVH